MIRQKRSDLLRCASRGAQGAVGGRAPREFLRLIWGEQDGRNPAGVHRAAYRCGLLGGVMAKVQQRSQTFHCQKTLDIVT